MTAVQLYDRSYRALRGAALSGWPHCGCGRAGWPRPPSCWSASSTTAYAVRAIRGAAPGPGRGGTGGGPDRAVTCGSTAAHELAAPVLLLLVRAETGRGDIGAGAAAAATLRQLATGSNASPLTAALADHAEGLVAAARAASTAVHHLESALAAFGRLGLPLEEARARLDLAARAHRPSPRWPRSRRAPRWRRFQALAATRDADAATSLLRRLGVRGHTGPRGDGTLTAREKEVLDLLGEGLSNADIAARLFISRRTAEHHVSNILAKLGLASRAEATAYHMRAMPER